MIAEIFREYDIRGIVDRDITPKVARSIGQALIQYLVQKGEQSGPIIVGHDHRLSSPTLAEAVIDGILDTGWDVIFISTVPTPGFYFALHTFHAKGGIMITASHNPPEFNGFKINHGPNSLYGPQIQELYHIITKNSFPKGVGTKTEEAVLDDYKQAMLSRITLSRPVKVVLDAGNGTAGLVAPELLQELGCEVIPLYCDLDGTFPNHHPDPTVKANLTDLIETVLQTESELGIGYDGDSDRIGIVDQKGAIIWGDRLLALFAQDLLTRQPGAKIIFEVKCSMALEETIKAAGGIPIMYRTGHSLIKKKMKEENSPLAGEMSGHMFFGENYFGYDDAIFASARLIEIVAKHTGPFSKLLDTIPIYPATPEIRIGCPENMKIEVVEHVKKTFRMTHKIIDVDGVRVLFENGWGLLRASNTQPVLVLRFEAHTDEALLEIFTLFKTKLSSFQGLDLKELTIQ